MSRTLTMMTVLVLASVALAGCTNGENGGDNTNTTTTTTTTTPPTTTPPTQDNETQPLGNASFTVAVSGVPTQALPGQRFNFTLYVNGTANVTSDHVGAHFSNNSTTTPVATEMRTCEHGAGALPGTFEVNCTIQDEGTWYLYGHARAAEDNQTYNWWATPVAVKVRNYTLNITGAPTGPVIGDTVRLRLVINGSDNVTSDHVGAHFFNATTADPTVPGSAGACAHVTAAVVGTHEIECKIPPSSTTIRTVYVYGHLRITEGATVLQWWSDPVEVQIPPSPI